MYTNVISIVKKKTIIIISPSFNRKEKAISVTAIEGNKLVKTSGIIINIAGGIMKRAIILIKKRLNINVYRFLKTVSNLTNRASALL